MEIATIVTALVILAGGSNELPGHFACETYDAGGYLNFVDPNCMASNYENVDVVLPEPEEEAE